MDWNQNNSFISAFSSTPEKNPMVHFSCSWTPEGASLIFPIWLYGIMPFKWEMLHTLFSFIKCLANYFSEGSPNYLWWISQLFLWGISKLFLWGISQLFLWGISKLFLLGISKLCLRGISKLFLSGISQLFLWGISQLFLWRICQLFLSGISQPFLRGISKLFLRGISKLSLWGIAKLFFWGISKLFLWGISSKRCCWWGFFHGCPNLMVSGWRAAKHSLSNIKLNIIIIFVNYKISIILRGAKHVLN